MIKTLFSFFIFPGFLFSAVLGLVLSGLERKLSARIQWRRGPLWYQSFLDIIKLFYKEIILPTEKSFTFVFAPLLSLVAVSLSSMILGNVILNPQTEFLGDLIVLVYLLLIPAISFVLGASASGNPFASIGVSREIKLLFGYELPFLLAILVVIIKTGSIRLGEIILAQQNTGSYIFSLSGFLAFLVSLVCVQAKLGFVPFDISEAEQEIMSGIFIEYSGLLLAIFRLTRMILSYIMPLFLIVLFLGKDISLGFLLIKFLFIFLIIALIKNTNPRLRIDQALRFFWGPLSILALVSIIFALFGY